MNSELKSDLNKQILAKVGNEFIRSLLYTRILSVVLKSKEPTVLLKIGNNVGFVGLCLLENFNFVELDDTVFLRLNVNTQPTPAVNYHLKSLLVRQKLKIYPTTKVLTTPSLELTCLPDEVEHFGTWIPTWLDYQLTKRTIPPKPPKDLIHCGWTELNETDYADFATLGPEWRSSNYLFTRAALTKYELNKLKGNKSVRYDC